MNDGCRWSSVRELAPEMTHWQRHPHKQRLGWESLADAPLSFLPCSRKCALQFFTQVEVERRERIRSVPSCCPTVRALNRSTGAHQSDAGAHRHSFPLTGGEDRQE